MVFVAGSGPGVEKNIACFGGSNLMKEESRLERRGEKKEIRCERVIN